MITLKEVVLWIISGGGAGVLGFWLVDNVPSLKALANMGWKRVTAISISAALGILFFGFGVFMEYVTAPGTLREWIEQLFQVGAIAGGLSQLIHGFITEARYRSLSK